MLCDELKVNPDSELCAKMVKAINKVVEKEASLKVRDTTVPKAKKKITKFHDDKVCICLVCCWSRTIACIRKLLLWLSVTCMTPPHETVFHHMLSHVVHLQPRNVCIGSTQSFSGGVWQQSSGRLCGSKSG